MCKRKINIIWADDENIPQLSEDYINHELKDEGFNLLGRARDAKNLSILIEQNKWKVDAVITDANMPYDIEEQNEDVAHRDLSGLNEVLSIKRQYNTILFYIYSGRADLLEERYTSELNDFKLNGRIFYKLDPNADIIMFDKIRKDVEVHSTPEFQIRFNFSEEFEAAEAIGADRKLMEALMREYNNEKCIPEEHLFVDARVIMEAIFKACSKIKTSPNKVMLPEGQSLKNYVRLLTLGKDQDEIFVMNENGRKLLPFPLTEELKCFNEITQDSAHPLKMNEYLNKLKGSHALSHIHLHHITWYILMDFLLWFKHSKDIYANSNTELWSYSYNVVDEVIITEITERYYLAKPYLLQRGTEYLNIGDKVGVFKSTLNNNSKYKDSYPKFVVSNFYFVISESNGE